MLGTVLKSTGSRYSVLSDEGSLLECTVKGKLRLEGVKTTNPIAVGDHVIYDPINNESGIITSVIKRQNYIIRKSTNLSKQTHIIAANIDRAFLVVTLSMPRTSTGFIDRYLLTAEAYGIPAGIVFNKTDICTTEELKAIRRLEEIYSKLGYTCIKTSALTNAGIAELKQALNEQVTLISGHSGTGKSTLLNKLIPDLNLKTGPLSEAHEKGTHTTTFAEMFIMNAGTFIIDTPGVKEFGIVDIEKQELAHYFPEMRALLNKCKFNTCTHIHEPGCAVINALEQNEIAGFRYDTYFNIMMGDELKKEYEK